VIRFNLFHKIIQELFRIIFCFNRNDNVLSFCGILVAIFREVVCGLPMHSAQKDMLADKLSRLPVVHKGPATSWPSRDMIEFRDESGIHPDRTRPRASHHRVVCLPDRFSPDWKQILSIPTNNGQTAAMPTAPH
jgi:hypothetical protein